jgi:hypothetical protein
MKAIPFAVTVLCVSIHAFAEADPAPVEDIVAPAGPQVEALPPRSLTAEEEAVQAMLPFVATGALLIVCALGGVRIARAVREMRSEAIVRRLREVRAAKESKEWTEEKARTAANEAAWEADRFQFNLRRACHEFMSAVGDHYGLRSEVRFDSLDECMELIPELVHDRRLCVDSARFLETNRHLIMVTNGELRSNAEERKRSDYLDGNPPAPAGHIDH